MAEEKDSKGIQVMELKGIIRMLSATTEKAEHLSMVAGTSSSPGAVRQYNAIVKRLGDIIPGDLFTPLQDDASFIDLGLCSGQLAAYLEGMVEEPAAKKDDEARKINAPYINISGGLPDMEELGKLIRQAMPSWIREEMEKEESEGEKEEPEADMNDVESRIAELGAQMQVLAERMHREELSSDEIRKMADQMRELGQQQSELAKQHASVRAKINETNG